MTQRPTQRPTQPPTQPLTLQHPGATDSTAATTGAGTEGEVVAQLLALIAAREIARACPDAGSGLVRAVCELADDGTRGAVVASDPAAGLAHVLDTVDALMQTTTDLPTQLRLDRCCAHLTTAQDELAVALNGGLSQAPAVQR